MVQAQGPLWGRGTEYWDARSDLIRYPHGERLQK